MEPGSSCSGHHCSPAPSALRPETDSDNAVKSWRRSDIDWFFSMWSYWRVWDTIWNFITGSCEMSEVDLKTKNHNYLLGMTWSDRRIGIALMLV